MSGLEVAGVLLGTFPLIISGIEHWRNCAKVGGYFWKVRKEYSRCRGDVSFHEILYKRNLKALLIPVVDEMAGVDALVSDPGGKGWKDGELEGKLVGRLQESYKVYVEIIQEMNEVVGELRKELCFDDPGVQQKLALPTDAKRARQPSPKPSKTLLSKSSMDYQIFRAKFAFGEKKRDELFASLKECNERLEKLLLTSDQMSALQSTPPSTTKQISTLENTFKKAYRKSELLFKALQKSWKCVCQPHHFANLRLEHRSSVEICFEIILMFIRPIEVHNIPWGWSWKELQCGAPAKSCIASPPVSSHQVQPQLAPAKPSSPPPTPPILKLKKVTFSEPTIITPKVEVEMLNNPAVHLCQLLGRRPECTSCMGVIQHGGEEYHIHPFEKRKALSEDAVTDLNFVLSSNFEGILSRRQRYSIALLLASSVAQLQFTPWLRNGLTKECVLFFCGRDRSDISFGEPFIRQGFSDEHNTHLGSADTQDCDFFSLGILLVELCFGTRLEDHPLRRKHAATDDADAKQAFDLMAAIQWSRGICDEGGEDYATAVRWCFTETGNVSKDWRAEMIKNVIRPLEMCQEHFKTTAVVQ